MNKEIDELFDKLYIYIYKKYYNTPWPKPDFFSEREGIGIFFDRFKMVGGKEIKIDGIKALLKEDKILRKLAYNTFSSNAFYEIERCPARDGFFCSCNKIFEVNNESLYSGFGGSSCDRYFRQAVSKKVKVLKAKDVDQLEFEF